MRCRRKNEIDFLVAAIMLEQRRNGEEEQEQGQNDNEGETFFTGAFDKAMRLLILCLIYVASATAMELILNIFSILFFKIGIYMVYYDVFEHTR